MWIVKHAKASTATTTTLKDSMGRQIGGPPRLFVGKTQITRSGQMTSAGNKLLDDERARLGKELGFDKDLSIGDVVELFLHYVGKNQITVEKAREIAAKINEKTAKNEAADTAA